MEGIIFELNKYFDFDIKKEEYKGRKFAITMPILEEDLKLRIVLFGKSKSILYEGKKEYPNTIHLRVKNKTTSILQRNTSRALKTLIKLGKTRRTAIFNPELVQFYDATSKTIYDGVPDKAETYFVHETKKENLEEEYNSRYRKFEEIQKLLANLGIDLDLNHGNLCCLNLAKDITYNVFNIYQDFEHIKRTETEFIHDVSTGAFTYVPKGYEFSDYIEYDINSLFPFLLSRIKFPTTEGRIEILEEIDLKKIGMHYLDIIGTYDERTFKENKYGCYTNREIKHMKKLGIQYKLSANKPSLVFDKYIDCSKLKVFQDVIEKMYELVKRGNDLAKQTIQRLWGAITTEYKTYIKISEIEPEHKILDYLLERKQVQIEDLTKRPYNYATGRLKPFILADSRIFISKLANKVLQKGYDIAKVNNDAIISNIPKDVMDEHIWPIGKDCGDFKIDWVLQGKHRIEHIRKTINVQTGKPVKKK